MQNGSLWQTATMTWMPTRVQVAAGIVGGRRAGITANLIGSVFPDGLLTTHLYLLAPLMVTGLVLRSPSGQRWRIISIAFVAQAGNRIQRHALIKIIHLSAACRMVLSSKPHRQAIIYFLQTRPFYGLSRCNRSEYSNRVQCHAPLEPAVCAR